MSDDQDSLKDKQLSRREFLKLLGAGSLSLGVGSFDNPWLIFSKYIDAVNKKCVQDMLPKWENKLGGAREVMSTLCFAMSQAGRIDPTAQALLQNSTFVYK